MQIEYEISVAVSLQWEESCKAVEPVSYTHLDVYKRQHIYYKKEKSHVKFQGFHPFLSFG